MQVLLATLLLVFLADSGMSIEKHDSSPTSNDLLHHLVAKHSLSNLNDKIVAESAEYGRNIADTPAVGIEPNLPE